MTGLVPYKFRKRPLAAVSLLPFYRKTRPGVDYFIGGGAALGCMNDLMVTQEASDVESNSHLDFLLLHNLRRHFIA